MVDNILMGRKNRLPPLDHDEDAWEVGAQPGDKVAYIATDKRSVWHNEVADITLYEQESTGAYFVCRRPAAGEGVSDKISFIDFVRNHQTCTWRLAAPELGRELPLQVAIFEEAQWGSKLAISIASLYDQLNLGAYLGLACGRFQKRMKSWRGCAKDLDLSPTFAVRSSLSWCSNVKKDDYARALTFNAVRGHFLVALLAILSFCTKHTGGLQSEVGGGE